MAVNREVKFIHSFSFIPPNGSDDGQTRFVMTTAQVLLWPLLTPLMRIPSSNDH